MKKNLMVLVMALSLATGWCGLAWGSSGANGPHSDYRTGYKPSACAGAACHTVSTGAFVPETLDNNAGTRENWNNFCLTCHNASGEAHEKTAGTPSNNTYINYTGLVPGDKGVSHSWKGLNKNAGTRTPASSFFNRTAYMASATIVACETCHKGPIKGGTENIDWLQASDADYAYDHINYKILGYSSTPQYLNQYFKVYRSASAIPTKLAQRRDWKQYLVSPSEYTYNHSNATITFGASQGANYIYVELAEPYLRGSNAGNALCLDCHNTRSDQQVSHEPGTGAKDNHPVAVNYGYGFGLQSTLKPAATGNAYLEGGQVLCTSCHDPHNAASTDGMILREADGYTLCADCHKTKLGGYSTAGSVNIHNGSKHSSATLCLDCHGTHDSRNIMLIRNVINGKVINFQNFSGANSFGNENGTSVCEACHTATTHHRASNDTGLGHYTSDRCTKCHKHETGFKYSAGGGGGSSGCGSCHPYPGSGNDWTAGNGHLVRYDSVANTHLVTSGYDYQSPTEYADMVADPTRCGKCHPNNPANHWNSNIDVQIVSGNDKCGPPAFNPNKTCSNVKCHGTHDSPNWY